MTKCFNLRIKKHVYFLLVFILGMILISIYNNNTKIKTDSEYVTKIMLSGFYEDKESSRWIPFDNINDISVDSSELNIITYANQDIIKGSRIMFYMKNINSKVFVNGTEIFESEKSKLSRWDGFESPGIKKGEQIRIILEKTSDQINSDIYKYTLDRLYCGSNYGMIKYQIKEKIIHIGICFLVFTVGMVILAIDGALRFFRIKARKGYWSCGLLLITGSLCTFNNHEYITLIFNNPSIVNVLDIVSEAMICELLIIYLSTYICTEKYLENVMIMRKVWPIAVIGYLFVEDFQIIDEHINIKIMITLILIMFFIEFIYLIKDYFKHKSQSVKYFLMSGIILLIATVIEIIHFYFTNVFWIYVFQGGIFIFTFVQGWVLMNSTKDTLIQSEKLRRLEAELVQKNIAIMISQIQPHFLYNSLTSIGYLCEKEPKKARKLLNNFSDYLRVNIDSFEMNKPVPFKKELEHVQTYLELEKVRFEDDLNVEYHIDTMEFMIPVLTVQPIVENAVKHGIFKKEDGGIIGLFVKETDSSYIIEVKDDGVGFDNTIKQNDGKIHVGIENVRKRLEIMCKGSLTIESEKDLGTTVTIKIPKEKLGGQDEDNSSR